MSKNIKHSLDGMWNLTFTMPEEDKIIKTETFVPGNVEPTLVKLGLIEDYMPTDDRYATTKFDYVDDWTYETTFDADKLNKSWKKNLVFEGIDTIAEVYLNDELISDVNNMHYIYRFDVTDKLKEKGNILKVVIRSCQLWAREHYHDMYNTPHGCTSFFDSLAYLRKTRHHWGWDNAPRILTSGIIRSVYVEELAPERFEEVYLYTREILEDEILLGAHWIYKTDKKNITNRKIKLTLSFEDKELFSKTYDVYHTQGMIRYKIPRKDVKLWWPSGFGNPDMHTVKIEMIEDNNVIADYVSPFGIRTIRLDRTDDVVKGEDNKFLFIINNERMFIRGTNWKPLHPLTSIADKKTKELKYLEFLSDLSCNMVRIWGGGIYEDEFFYEYCDKHGIMIWQDFMFACEIPPVEEEYCELVKKEAIQVIKRYRNYASLAVWCGDNENDEYIDFYSNIRPSANILSRKYLKDAVIHHDPYHAYVDSSPFSSDENCGERVDKPSMVHFQSERHLYPDTTNYQEVFRTSPCIFVGETGPINTCSIAVNDRIFNLEKARLERLWDAEIDADGIFQHQQDAYFANIRQGGKKTCLKYFNKDFKLNEWKDYVIAVNLVCAEVLKDIIEISRVKRWEKSGFLWWSLIDMWPMIYNFSVMDCDMNKKLGYFWIKKSHQEFALMAVRKEIDGEMNLYAVNDTLKDEVVSYTVTEYNIKGEGALVAKGICEQKANSSSMIQRMYEGSEPKLWIFKWVKDGKEYLNHAITGYPEFDVAKKWVEIIGKECGIIDEILELK